MGEEQVKHTNGSVISGKAVVKKKNILQKFKNAIVREDSKSIGEYIFDDVVVPIVIGGVSNILHSSIDAWLNRGDSRPTYGYSGGSSWRPNTQMISYGSFYGNKKPNQPQPVDRTKIQDFGDVIVPTKADADEVIFQMDELISKFNQASIADLLDLVGEVPPTTMHRYGWTDFSAARAMRLMDGTYKIVTPRAELLQQD